MPRYIDLHTHKRSGNALCVVSYGLGRDEIPADPGGPWSAGIHPWDAAGLDGRTLDAYLDYLRHAPVSAVGECGLDYTRGGDHARQIEVLRAQIDIACRRNLPAIIHCVRAHNDFFSLVPDHPGTTFILHGYVGSPQLTRRALELGCYFSIGERSLGSQKTVSSLRSIPPERIFAETDESPVTIAEIYGSLARVMGLDVESLAEIIKTNYKNIFG